MCVIGAGTMGWSIAQVFATAEYDVVLCDMTREKAIEGKKAMDKSLSKRVDKGKLKEAKKQKILNNVHPGVYKDVADCKFAIEAIFEDMQAKENVFKQLENIMPSDAILATNTSSLSITELASHLKVPERFIGMHFFNPAPIMKLVEVVHGYKTSQKTTDKALAIAEEVGKIPVQVKESPGFIVNRILIPYINEGIGIFSEGIASAKDIDSAMRLGANHPLGPLELGDLVGLDVCLAILEVLQSETGDPKYRPHLLLRKMVRAGKLGKKTGEGFYQYP